MWPFKPRIRPPRGDKTAVILGNGVAGANAALKLRKHQPEWRIILISGESEHHWSRPALMYLYMGHMRWKDVKPYEDRVWEEKSIERVCAWVTEIDTKAARLQLDNGSTIPYDKLLLATGSNSNKFGWPGQDLKRVSGMYSLQDLLQLEEATNDLKRGVVVGGGLIGIELAEMMLARKKEVTMLVREKVYWGNALPPQESGLVIEEFHHHHVDLRLETELDSIEGDSQGRAVGVKTKGGEHIDCQYVGLTAGVHPNIALAKAAGINVGRGIRVGPSLETSEANIYAAGDCVELMDNANETEGRGIIEAVWYTGRAMADIAAQNMAGGNADYIRGIWFNSAKFFHLEWHTYGEMKPNEIAEAPDRSLWWRAPDERICMHVFLNEDGSVKGLNSMGLRQRHRTWEKWIDEKVPMKDILPKLIEANFDPELFKKHESAIQHAFMEKLS